MALTNYKDIQKRFAEGKGFYTPFLGAETPGGVNWNDTQYETRITCRITSEFASTYPSTLNSINRPGGTASRWLTHSFSGFNKTCCGWLGFFYKIGTLNFAATGDQFTHDAATFPILRSYFGQASQPVPLIPILQVTTQVTTTEPRFRLQTNAGGAGYVNQAGTSVVGTYTMGLKNMPKATSFAMIMPLETNDAAVRDITQIRIDTAASAGAAAIWGFEPLMHMGSFESRTFAWRDAVFGGMGMMPYNPGAATSGTATSFLGALNMNAPDTVMPLGLLAGVLD